ncbi:hypothetical protein [Hymenobacter pini]|uniref:hypothetical protein n=1 Tax=Hymenobacter pini TaxID=2880879 RepID=UPI001CF2930E|nr:hypothetical protein [Hymenobacter pini]
MLFGKKPRPKEFRLASLTFTDYTTTTPRIVSAAELPALRSFELQLNAYVTDQNREYRLYTVRVISPDLYLPRMAAAHAVFTTGYLLMQHLSHEALVGRLQQLLAASNSATTWPQLDVAVGGCLQPIVYSPHLLPDPAAPVGYAQAEPA